MIASSWDSRGSLPMHVNVQLMNMGYVWDPALSDSENRAAFHLVCERVLNALKRENHG